MAVTAGPRDAAAARSVEMCPAPEACQGMQERPFLVISSMVREGVLRNCKQKPASDAGSRGIGKRRCHALVLSERTAVPLDSVEDIALANAQSVDPHARVVFRHRRWVKGIAFWFLKIEATVETIPMVYWGYFYVGEDGTVQVITYTEKSRLPEYEQGFADFLNGLTVSR